MRRQMKKSSCETPLKIMRPPDCNLCQSQTTTEGGNVYECDDCGRVVRWMQSTLRDGVQCHGFVVLKEGTD